jgi:CHAT domain-containing protein
VGILANTLFFATSDHIPSGLTRQTMSNCISSYLPTLRSLAFARSRPSKRYLNKKQDSPLLVIIMPISPSRKGKHFPSVASEAAMFLSASSATDISTEHLNQPSISSVMQELPICNIIYFACHKYPDPTNHSNSHLILQDGDLSVARIVRSHAANADLAYLSACSTAVYKDSRLADEGLHVVISFQLVGFRHVVGTLWDTIDLACQEVASESYRVVFTLNSENENEQAWDGK